MSRRVEIFTSALFSGLKNPIIKNLRRSGIKFVKMTEKVIKKNEKFCRKKEKSGMQF